MWERNDNAQEEAVGQEASEEEDIQQRMEGKQDGSSPGQVGGRACPACVEVGQVARRRDVGVAAGGQSWRPEEEQDIVQCMNESVDRAQEVVVAAAVEECGRVDEEVGSAVEMVPAAYRSSRSCEIEICRGSGSARVSVSRSAELPGHRYAPDYVIEKRSVGYPDSTSCRCTAA